MYKLHDNKRGVHTIKIYLKDTMISYFSYSACSAGGEGLYLPSFVVLLLVALLSNSYIMFCRSTPLSALQSQLSETKEVIPENQLQKTIKIQDDLLKILEHASYYISSAKVTYPYHNHRRYSIYEESAAETEQKIRPLFHDGIRVSVDIDVMFVGFPSSAINVIRENWFDNLDRSDPLLTSLGPFHDLKESLGGAYFGYNFHLVQVSFQVMDSIRKRMEGISHNFNASTVHVWEMEEILDSLAEVVSSTHTSTSSSSPRSLQGPKLRKQPSASVFILNTQVPQVKYSSQFDRATLLKAANDPKILDLCKKIVNEPKRKSKIVETASIAGALSIQSGDVRSRNELFAEKSRKQKINLDSISNSDDLPSASSVHWRDAVTETKAWAADVDAYTASFTYSPDERLTRILEAPKGNFLSRYSLPLASRILTLSTIVSDGVSGGDSDSNMYDFGGDPTCSSTVHTGSGRLAWIDISADASKLFHQTAGGAAPAPEPKIVEEKEWYSIGDESNAERNLDAQISSLKIMLLRHLKLAKHQYENSDCTQMMYFLDRFERSPGHSHVDHLQSILEYLLNEFHYGYTQSDCGVLSFEMAFLNVTVESVNDIYADFETEGMLANRDPFMEDLLKKVLLKSLIQAVDLIGVYVESNNYRDSDGDVKIISSTAHKFISEDVVMYLSHISSNILKIVRHWVTPPVSLSIPMDLKHNIRAYVASSSSSRAVPMVANPVSKVVEKILSPSMHFGRKKSDSNAISNNWDYFGNFASENIISGDSSQSLFHSIQPGLQNSYKSYLYSKECGSDLDHFSTYESKSINAVCEEDANLAASTVTDDENILYWASLKPYSMIVRRVNIVLYVIRTHKSYYPLSDYIGSGDGFDYGTYMTELMRLKFDNQDMSISANLVDAFSEEPSLAISLDRCFMTGYTPISSGYYYSSHSVERREYMDSGCVLSHIKKFDTTIERDSRHIPIYLISFDKESPVLLNNQEQAIAIDESVIIAQNYQLKIKSSMCCGERNSVASEDSTAVFISGRNPVAAALRVTATALAGVGGAHQGHKGQATTFQSLATIIDFDSLLRRNQGDVSMAHISKSSFCSSRKNIFDSFKHYSRNSRVDSSRQWDWSSFSGDSPRLLLSQSDVPRFSDLDVLLVKRVQVMRTLGLANAILSFEHSSVGDKLAHYKEINDISRSQELVMDDKIQAFVSRVDSLIERAVSGIEAESWSSAAYFAAAALDAAAHPQDFIKFDQSEFAFTYKSSDGSGSDSSEDSGAADFGNSNNNNNNINSNSVDDVVFTATLFWVSLIIVLISFVVYIIYKYRTAYGEFQRPLPVSFRNSI